MTRNPDVMRLLNDWSEQFPDPEYKRWLSPLIEKAVPHIVAPGLAARA